MQIAALGSKTLGSSSVGRGRSLTVTVPFLLGACALGDQYGVVALLKIAPAFIIGGPGSVSADAGAIG